MTPRPAPLLQLGALCSLPALLAFWFASPDSAATFGSARPVMGVGSALGLALLLAGLALLFARAWTSWRAGGGTAGLLRWAGLALLSWPLAFTDLLGLSALSGDTLAVSVTYASAGVMYGTWALWLTFSLGLLWLGRVRG